MDENDFGIVALDGDRVIGMLNMRQDKRKKMEHIAQFGISLQRFYSGTGTKMIEAALDFAKKTTSLKRSS